MEFSLKGCLVVMDIIMALLGSVCIDLNVWFPLFDILLFQVVSVSIIIRTVAISESE